MERKKYKNCSAVGCDLRFPPHPPAGSAVTYWAVLSSTLESRCMCNCEEAAHPPLRQAPKLPLEPPMDNSLQNLKGN
jgi:hypothetical protein